MNRYVAVTLVAVAWCGPGLSRSLAQDQPSDQVIERGWPKELSTAEGGKLVVYQPQVETWTNFARLEGRAALAYARAEGETPQVGTARLTAQSEADLNSRLVRVHSLVLEDVRFPSLSDGQAQLLAAELKRHADGKEMIVELDHLVADVEQAQVQARRVSVNTDPPAIFVSQDPAILVQFDGEPVESPIRDSEVTFVVNTNWDVLKDSQSGRWYLLNEGGWLQAETLDGPWTPALAPDSFRTLPADDNWATVRSSLPGQSIDADAPPRVFVSQTPAELILMEGEPDLSVIPDTDVMWATNTESDLFLSSYDGRYYYLVSGRWFSTGNLTGGPWEFASRRLPPGFKAIPEDHPASHVLASVPGTAQAEEAVILAQIPQTARINRATVEAPDVRFHGEPEFETIPGTSVSRAINTSSDIMQVGDLYYLCFQGVWFRSAQPTGPWEVTADVPDSIYQIPAESPSHHVTYVVVEDDDDDEWIQVAVMAGYMGMYWASDWGCMVWGTGWYYPPYMYYGGYYPIYYPYPVSYGGGSWYNPATGRYGRAVAGYGPYGGLGYGATYNPRTGTYARGSAAYGLYGAGRQAVAFNPRTGTAAATVQRTNYYESWGTSAVVRGDDWVRTARYANDDVRVGAFTTSRGGTGLVGIDDDNNLYAGRDGNVYRRNDNGQWQRRENGNWSSVDGPTAEQRQQAQQRATEARDRVQEGGGRGAGDRVEGRSGTASRPTGTTLGGLDRDAYDRARGRQRVDGARGRGSFGGGVGGGGRIRGRRR